MGPISTLLMLGRDEPLRRNTGGALTDISPTPPLTAPGGLVGGYGDDLYMNPPPPDDLCGTPRAIPSSVAVTRVPTPTASTISARSSTAMTSADGRS